MGLKVKEVMGRLDSFQPTTWVGHLLVAEVVWLLVDITPFILTIILLTASVGVFFWREWAHYENHRRLGHPKHVWLGDGVGDMVGPLTVLWAALGDPWMAHAVGLSIIGLGSMAWVGLGYHKGG